MLGKPGHAAHVKRWTNMQRSIRWWWVICFAILFGSTTAHGELFQADSKRYGNSKMDIVVTEVERRPHSSVIDLKITLVGSSVGSSFFLLCSIRQLAQLRGNYHLYSQTGGETEARADAHWLSSRSVGESIGYRA